ncbi:MAG TPA: ABC-type transport auxiliary lipoprotein family protein [Albitalea sp.]|nr:ABC-type transport auxiliary lipoprotein family protein [Albitalea sp.]
MSAGPLPRLVLAGTVLAGALAACALMSPARLESTKAVLNKLPAQLPQPATRAASVLVFAPETQPVYDTTQMAYTTQAYQVAYFSRHEWAETPSQMVQPLLVSTLRRTGAFSAVLVPPHAGRVSYALRSEIVELVQDFMTRPPTLRLGLHVELRDDASGRVVASKDIVLREPMQQPTPEAGVAAANEALSKALQELVRFVLDKAG